MKPHYESKKLCLAVLIAMLFFSSSGYSVVILKWVEDSGTRLPIAVRPNSAAGLNTNP